MESWNVKLAALEVADKAVIQRRTLQRRGIDAENFAPGWKSSKERHNS